MSHLRDRHILDLLKTTFKYSAIVGLFGHRQVGKTTLTELVTREYVTLDSQAQLQLISENPESFLQQRKHPFGIDEAQLSPPLFPALKEAVRTSPQPGQYLLTGSVRFSSRKQIRESLTGRIIAWELLPMDLAETHSRPLRNSLEQIANSKKLDIDLKTSTYFSRKNYDQYIQSGGLPGIFSMRNESMRRQRMELQIETLLERDLRLLLETKISYSSLRNLLAQLASQQGEPLAIYELSRRSSISVPSLMKLIPAFEAMYLIRFLPTLGSQSKKVLFFEDQGEASYLTQKSYGPLQDMVRFLYANLRTQWSYQNKLSVQPYQLRNRGGAYVPLALHWDKKMHIGIIPIVDDSPSKQALGSAQSFIRKENTRVLFVHHGKRDELIHPQMRILPWGKLL